MRYTESCCTCPYSESFHICSAHRASINLFDGVHENPELIWTDQVRNKVKDIVRKMKSEWHDTLLADPAALWRLPDNFETVYQGVCACVYL